MSPEQKSLVDELLALEGVPLQKMLVRHTEEERRTNKIREVCNKLHQQFESAELAVGEVSFRAGCAAFSAVIDWHVERSSYRLSLDVRVGRQSSLEEQDCEVYPAFQLAVRYILRGQECRFRMAAKTSQNRDGSMEFDLYQQALLTIEGLPVVVESVWD